MIPMAKVTGFSEIFAERHPDNKIHLFYYYFTTHMDEGHPHAFVPVHAVSFVEEQAGRKKFFFLQ